MAATKGKGKEMSMNKIPRIDNDVDCGQRLHCRFTLDDSQVQLLPDSGESLYSGCAIASTGQPRKIV